MMSRERSRTAGTLAEIKTNGGKKMNKVELLTKELTRVDNLNYGDSGELDAIRKKLHLLSTKFFGIATKYALDIKKTSFYPMAFPSTKEYEVEVWNSGKKELRNIVVTMIEEIQLFGGEDNQVFEDKKVEVLKPIDNRKIFVVHGHDDLMKQTVARTIEKIDFEAIILHEQENRGRSIIEKFTDHSDVGFAVVLLSPDDVGSKMGGSHTLSSRARQNVVFEMGYFIGKLGRERVVVLHPSTSDFEMPSDYSGVIYIDYDEKGTWRFELAKELKACGYDIDLNKLL
jgi:predicted nucleotide-binding protein